MKKYIILLIASSLSFTCCTSQQKDDGFINGANAKIEQKTIDPSSLIIEKQFLYDQHTLTDTFAYKDSYRVFQWDKIRARLAMLEVIEKEPVSWAILQNYKNANGGAPLVKNSIKDAYNRNADTFGVQQYQSVPLYSLKDISAPVRYGRDGSLVRLLKDTSEYCKIETVFFTGEWLVPQKYVEKIDGTDLFNKVIFIDKTNQNITTLEKAGEKKWLVRSMNPATTGLHRPPYQQETPNGIFVLQEKKPKMLYLKDGSDELGGFAPYANRFTNGGYIHGVPINSPNTKMVEFSSTLGTTPRSHMCVRNATSHAKFIYDWAPVEGAIIFVIE